MSSAAVAALVCAKDSQIVRIERERQPNRPHRAFRLWENSLEKSGGYREGSDPFHTGKLESENVRNL